MELLSFLTGILEINSIFASLLFNSLLNQNCLSCIPRKQSDTMSRIKSALYTGLSIFVLVFSQETSHDGNCGNGVSCAGSFFGGCCNAAGKCGS